MSSTTTLGALPPSSGLVLAILSCTIPFFTPATKPLANFLANFFAADTSPKRMFAEAFLSSILASMIKYMASLAAASPITAFVLQVVGWSVTTVDNSFGEACNWGFLRDLDRESLAGTGLHIVCMVAQLALLLFEIRFGGLAGAGAGNGNRHGRRGDDVGLLLPSFGEFVGLLRESEVAAISPGSIVVDQVREDGAAESQEQDACEEEPTCMVCWSDEPSARPKMLPCGHLICLDCLVRLKKDTRDYCLCLYCRRPMFAVVGAESGLQL